MSKKNNYWVQRAIEQERLKDEIARDYIERTEKQLREYERQLKREIEAFYARYAIDHKMTQKEAMKYLRDDERKEFQEATLEKFREMALDPNADQALLDALSYRHRISRKEALLAEIQSKTAQLYAKPGGLKDTADQVLSDVYVRGKVETAKMFAKAGIIHEPKLDKHMIKERMGFKWTDKHFSERIWGQNRRTYEAIATVLNNGFTGGWSLDRIKKELSAKIKGVPLHRMDTLIKTEATAFNTLAMKDMLLELDTKKYSVVAVIDSRTSEICSHQNEKVYDMDKLEIGVNAPPFHPRCRSTIAPVEDDDDFDYFQEPEDRKANGKRTLDEILADWEKKAEKLAEQLEEGTPPRLTKDVSVKYHSNFNDDIKKHWETLSESKDKEELEKLLKDVYFVGELMPHELFSSIPTSVFMERHSLARSLAKHGHEFGLDNMLLITDMLSKPNIIADNSDKHLNSFLLYKEIPGVDSSLMEGVVIPKEDGTYIIHYHRITKRKLKNLEKKGKILYKSDEK